MLRRRLRVTPYCCLTSLVAATRRSVSDHHTSTPCSAPAVTSHGHNWSTTVTQSSCSFLFSAPPSLLDRVAQCGTTQTFSEGHVLIAEGSKATFFYVLVDGRIDVAQHGVAIRRIATPGEVGGLSSALAAADGASLCRLTTHTVTSASATVVLIPEASYKELIQTCPDFAVRVVQYLQARVRNRLHPIELLQRRDVSSFCSACVNKFRITIFNTKPYDRKYLDRAFQEDLAAAFELKYVDCKLNESTAALAAGSNAVCIFVNDSCSAKVLATLKTVGVSLVLLRCAGYDNVDLERAASLGIAVMRVPSYSPNAIAEHAFALLATVNRKTARAYSRVRDGNFSLAGLEGRDLNGLTCGVVGLGKIGKCFASVALGCGMKVVAWDAAPDRAWTDARGVELITNIDDLFRRSDVVSFHVPLTPMTSHLADSARLSLLPRGAILINTSRGNVVDSQALLQHLVSGHLGGAGLDVYDAEAAYFFDDCSERPIEDATLARLVNMPNVVMTSHQSFLTDKALTAIGASTLQNAHAFVKAQRAAELEGGRGCPCNEALKQLGGSPVVR